MGSSLIRKSVFSVGFCRSWEDRWVAVSEAVWRLQSSKKCLKVEWQIRNCGHSRILEFKISRGKVVLNDEKVLWVGGGLEEVKGTVKLGDEQASHGIIKDGKRYSM